MQYKSCTYVISYIAENISRINSLETKLLDKMVYILIILIDIFSINV